jgi:hypothetical protein
MKRYEVLEKLIKKHGWTKGAEIGVYKGATFFYLLDHCPDLHLIGVDSWKPLPSTQVRSLDKGLSDPAARTPAKMERFSKEVVAKAGRYKGRAQVWIADSAAAADDVKDGSLDFIFVDADHSTESVLADLAAWRPKVREGGWLTGHDEQWGSVRRALKQLFPGGWRVHQDNVWTVP